jgi:chemotaxis protein methyltransferase CheR
MSPIRHGAAVLADEPPAAPVREFAFSEADFKTLKQLAYDYAGIALSESKQNLIYSRLSRRLRVLKLSSFRDYCEYIGSHPSEVENFINSISTNHTKFFREAHHFEHFRTHVAVPFAQATARKPGGRLRVWSAGCSTGEEPYTIAVVLKHSIGNFGTSDVRILATDIDTDVLARAADGEFAASSIDEVPREYQSFFSRKAGQRAAEKATMDEELRSLISFRRLNLMEAWPFRGPFDAIFCRNVMIYFDISTKSALVDRFIEKLKPGGWLYIGHSESLIGSHSGLDLVGRTTYRRVP